MALDTAGRRFSMMLLAGALDAPLPFPDGSLNTTEDRALLLGIYAILPETGGALPTIDTPSKRFSMMALAGGDAPHPFPDGGFDDAGDRLWLLELYAGLEPTPPPVGGTLTSARMRITLALDAVMVIE